MKIIYNKILPPKNFLAINLFGWLFVRHCNKSEASNPIMLNHEAIHTAQMREMLYIPFYVWYFVEWIIRLFVNGTHKAYYKLLHEQEAYANQHKPAYLATRKPYAWLRNTRKSKTLCNTQNTTVA